MNFRQLAFNNVMRNARTYGAYFLSSSFSVMIFFVYAMFITHPVLAEGRFGHAKVAMTIAEYIIYIFSFFFVFYSVSAFLKTRKHEFGVFMIHGMSKGQLNRLVFMENMLIGIGSIVTGIITGMVFANLFLMIGAKVLRIEKLPFYWPWDAIKLTVLAFIILFVVISFFTAVFVRSNKLIELLQGSAKPKAEPKASIWLSLFAGILILTGYVVSFVVQGIQVVMAMMPVVAIVTVGTYFLFSQLMVYTVRLLKKNRLFYWRRTNIIAISDLAYRMKDNARMYFMVAIVSTVTICALGTFTGLQEAFEAGVKETSPFAITYISEPDNAKEQDHLNLIESKLTAKKLDYKKIEIPQLAYETDVETGNKRAIISLSDFNRIGEALGFGAESLEVGEVLRVDLPKFFGFDDTVSIDTQNGASANQTISFQESGLNFQLKGTTTRNYIPYLFIKDYEFYVVADGIFGQLNEKIDRSYVVYDVPKLKETTEIGRELSEEMDSSNDYWITLTALVIDQVREAYSLILFVGLFVSIVFFIATGSFLYFRLYTDLAEDKRHYRAIARLGLSEGELSKIATIQVALLFYAPFIVAVLHSSVAMYALHSFFSLSVLKSALMVIGSFFAAQTLFFLFIRARYVKHLKEAIR